MTKDNNIENKLSYLTIHQNYLIHWKILKIFLINFIIIYDLHKKH